MPEARGHPQHRLGTHRRGLHELDVSAPEANDHLTRPPHVDGRAIHGLTGEKPTAFSERMGILVVGSRGHSPLRRMVAGPSDCLEHHARCSVLALSRIATTGIGS